jgi:hypothetical protein
MTEVPIDAPVTGGDGALSKHPCFPLSESLNKTLAEVPLPRAHASKQAGSGLYRYPTRRQPAARWVHLRPQPLPRARGAGRRPHLPASASGARSAAHPARNGGGGEAFLEKFKGSPYGRRASKARRQAPDLREESGQRGPALPAPPTERKEAEQGARAAGSGSRAVGARESPGPPRAAQGAESGTSSDHGRSQEAAWPGSPPPVLIPRTSPQTSSRAQPRLRPRGRAQPGRTPAPGGRAPEPLHLRLSLPRLPRGPEGCVPTLGGRSAAEPGLMPRREVAASPSAGGGCSGTRRGGGTGARRPGPARGCHLEARRRSRGTPGGGSGGDGSSST